MRLRAIREEREIPTEADLFERVRALARDNLARVGSAQDANADSSISEWSDSNFRKSLTNGNRHYNRCLDLICEVLAGLDPGQQPLDVKIEQQKARIWDGAPAQQVTRSSLSSERQGSAIALADDVPDSGAAAFETFRLDSIRYHEAAMADRQLALRHYGQSMCPLLRDDANPVITREHALQELEYAATPAPVRRPSSESTSIRSSPVIVLGEEGVGKSWLVAQWWLERHRDSAFVFIPSNRFRGSSIDAPKLVADSIKGILAPERARTRNADDKWRRHIQSDAFKAAAQGKMIIVVDGLNETPVADWLTILVDVWDQAVAFGAHLVVTCRPSYWISNRDLRHVSWPDPAELRLSGFSSDELGLVLRLHGRRMEEIPARLRQRLSNPRIFALAMRLMETMPHEKNLGVDRLLFSYWEHRRLERHDLRMLDPDGSGFLNALAAHAEHFHKQRLIAVREVGTDLGAEEVVYPDQDLRNRFAGLQRYRDLTHDEISILVGEIRGGQFFLGETARMAPTYRFQSSALGFALGLYLVHEALQVLQKTRKGSELDALREHFAILLEPVMAFDQTADQLLAAITVACLELTVPRLVASLFIELFIGLQNRPEPLRSEFVGLAVEAPQPFFLAADSLLVGADGERIDTWLIDALRRAYRGKSGLRLFEEWLVSPPLRYERHFPYPPIEARDLALKREVCTARAVIGLPLAPLVEGLVDWALLWALRFDDGAEAGSRIAEAPIARSLRANDADPEDVEQEVIRLAGNRISTSAEADVTKKAFALLLAVIASPSATAAAERFWPGVLEVIDTEQSTPLAPIYKIVDPHIPQSELASSANKKQRIVDVNSPHCEEQLAHAARSDVDMFLKLVQTSLAWLAKHKSDDNAIRERAQVLDLWAVSAPSVFKKVPGRRFKDRLIEIACHPAICDPENGPARAAKDSLGPLDHVLEVVFAARSADQYKDVFLAIPWGRLPSDHWPIRPHRWRPQLSAELVEALVAESLVSLMSDVEERNVFGANLLEALAFHPVEALTDTTTTALSKLFLAQEALTCRLSALALAGSAECGRFAFAIKDAGWRASEEVDRTAATLASGLLCNQLAVHLPLKDLAGLVLPSALPAAAESINDDELINLANLILDAVRSGIALSEAASAGAEGAAALEKFGHVYRMLPFEPRGAMRLSDRVDGFADTCFNLLTKEAIASPRNSLCEALGTTLAAGVTASLSSAAEYVEVLVRRRSNPTRPLGARIVTAGLAVATRQPTARQRLLDLLVLTTNSDESLARLAVAVLALPGEAMTVVEAYVESLLESGRTVRIAYGLTLAGFLSHRSERLRRSLQSHRHRGYLARVSENAAWVKRYSDAANHWAQKRLATGDLGAEYLALSIPSRPIATLNLFDSAKDEDMTNVLFRHRLFEKSVQSAGDGLFGQPKAPRWLFERDTYPTKIPF